MSKGGLSRPWERLIRGRYGTPAAEVIGEPDTTFASSQVAYVHTHRRHRPVRGLVLEIWICCCVWRSGTHFAPAACSYFRCPSPCPALGLLITQLMGCRWGTSDIPHTLIHIESIRITHSHTDGACRDRSWTKAKGASVTGCDWDPSVRCKKHPEHHQRWDTLWQACRPHTHKLDFILLLIQLHLHLSSTMINNWKSMSKQ